MNKECIISRELPPPKGGSFLHQRKLLNETKSYIFSDRLKFLTFRKYLLFSFFTLKLLRCKSLLATASKISVFKDHLMIKMYKGSI